MHFSQKCKYIELWAPVKMEKADAATFEVWLTSGLENSLLAYH